MPKKKAGRTKGKKYRPGLVKPRTKVYPMRFSEKEWARLQFLCDEMNLNGAAVLRVLLRNAYYEKRYASPLRRRRVT